MKPVNLSQLLFHHPSRTLSFFYSTPKGDDVNQCFEAFFEEMLQGVEEKELLELAQGQKAAVLKVIKRHPHKTCGVFLSEKLKGYISLEISVEPYYQIGPNFHVRPILEDTVLNPEFILINVSFYDIKVYRGDFHHIEVLDLFEFEHFDTSSGNLSPRFFAPKFMGIIPYKTILAIKMISRRMSEKFMYESVPVIVTGLSDTRQIFLEGFDHSFGVISHLEEDFYEKTCMEILQKCKNFRNIVADYYSAQLKERLKRLSKSQRLLSDFDQIVSAVAGGRVIHLVIPQDRKLWGKINFETVEYEIHKREQKKDPSMDILNELAEEVMKQGGKIQILPAHFFPVEAQALAILKGSKR